jgi:thiamine transport system permease protein
MLPLAVSSLVLGTGLFVMLRPIVPPVSLALPVTVAVNALLALPFAFRILAPEAETLHRDYHRLAASLNLSRAAWLRWVVLPRLARPAGFAAGLTAAFAMGDLGVIALFAGEGATLPLTIHRLMGAYRMEDAASAALVLVVLSLALFLTFDSAGRHAAA